MMRTLALLSAIAILAACAGGQPRAETPEAAPARSGLEELAPRDLPAGRCTLILFTREAASRRVLIAYDEPAVALVNLQGREVELARTDIAGDVQFGHATFASYAADGVRATIDVAFDAARAADGAAVRSGSITLAEAGGSATVTPVVGVAACAPAGQSRSAD
jgi:hypothetical protein